MPAPFMVTLAVAHTWDGEPLGADEIAELRVSVDPEGGLLIEIESPFWNDPRPPAAPGPCDRLWEFEAVELFVAGAEADGGAQHYTEIELGPHGHYLVLQFQGARNAIERASVIEHRATIEGKRWIGRARVPAELLPARPWTANAFALHGERAERRFLASTPMPGSRPDFHRPELFAALPPVELQA